MSTTANIKVESNRRGLLLIDAQEVARRLDLSERTVWRLVAAGKLPNPISIGDKSKRWRANDIRSWVAAGCPDCITCESPRLLSPDVASGSDVPSVAVAHESSPSTTKG